MTAVNWSQHWCEISFLLGSQTTVRVKIGMPVVRTNGRSVGHPKFSGMGRFIYPWCSAGGLRARSSAIKVVLSFKWLPWYNHITLNQLVNNQLNRAAQIGEEINYGLSKTRTLRVSGTISTVTAYSTLGQLKPRFILAERFLAGLIQVDFWRFCYLNIPCLRINIALIFMSSSSEEFTHK